MSVRSHLGEMIGFAQRPKGIPAHEGINDPLKLPKSFMFLLSQICRCEINGRNVVRVPL